MIGVRLGAGREADVYAWGGDAVLKLYRPGFGGHRAEATALAELDGHGLAPQLIDTVEHDGRAGLVLERLDGTDMLSLLRRQPWRMPGLGQALAATHLAVHRVRAPAGLPALREVVAARIAAAALPPRLRDHARRLLDGLPDDDRLCHGDYHPGNVLLAADRIAVIDWPNAARGAPAADHARTTLLLRWADPFPGTPVPVRALAAAGRSVLARGYTRAYRRGAARPARQAHAWLVVHAAARVSEGIEGERRTLLAFLDRSRRRR